MSPKKLTEDHKKAILQLYRETKETTSTLAERYGVSSSTISRFLKNSLSNAEYEDLIQQKRLARTSKSKSTPKLSLEKELFSRGKVAQKSTLIESTPKKPSPIKKQEILTPKFVQEEDLDEDEDDNDVDEVDVTVLEEMFGEDLSDLDEDLDEDEEDDWEEDEIEENYGRRLSQNQAVQVLPLSAASFPKTCYVVIDRGAELITKPLKEFADLGKIPATEMAEKTLPVFDNHRVARRFSNRSQRVIKVPDGRMLQQVGSCLKAKGITLILLDGNIYSLSPSQ